MHYSRGQLILSVLAIVIGLGLVFSGSRNGPVQFAGGGFITTIGLGSLLLTLGSVLPGLPGRIFSHSLFKAAITLIVVFMLLITLYFTFNH